MDSPSFAKVPVIPGQPSCNSCKNVASRLAQLSPEISLDSPLLASLGIAWCLDHCPPQTEFTTEDFISE